MKDVEIVMPEQKEMVKFRTIEPGRFFLKDGELCERLPKALSDTNSQDLVNYYVCRHFDFSLSHGGFLGGDVLVMPVRVKISVEIPKKGGDKS